MNDIVLNAEMRAMDREDFPFAVRGLEGSGKIVPYIGWFWRAVDFSAPEFWLGYCNDSCGQFVGFMQNNKWDYPEFCITAEQVVRVRELLVAVAVDPNETTCQALFDYMQTLAPEWVKKKAQQ